MNRHHHSCRLLLAALLGACILRTASAGPSPQTVAGKPKFAPRAVPGLSASSLPTVVHPVAAPAKPAPRQPSAVVSAATTGDETRILMIYRRGSAALPPSLAVPPTPAAAPAPALVRPVSFTNPRPGEVRIISKAEADALAAQPNPSHENSANQ